MDILPTHQVIEATRATLVGKYMGETPKLVNQMCDHAMGGILFIDEAYTLCGDNDPYGHEAIETLMKRMEDDRGKFVVVLDEVEFFARVVDEFGKREFETVDMRSALLGVDVVCERDDVFVISVVILKSNFRLGIFAYSAYIYNIFVNYLFVAVKISYKFFYTALITKVILSFFIF